MINSEQYSIISSTRKNHLQEHASGRNAVETFGLHFQIPGLPLVLTSTVWLFFLASIVLVTLFAFQTVSWQISGWINIDGLTVIMWAAVTFFSGIVHQYSLRYLEGYRRKDLFFIQGFAFTIAVIFFLAADHILLLMLSWLSMGLLMSELIGNVKVWKEARAAAMLGRRNFLASTFLLGAGLYALSSVTGEYSITGIVEQANTIPWLTAVGAMVFVLLAALIQSAIFPFHKWLLSAMTAPTPASALMHAGFVNAAGILLARFAPMLNYADVLWLIAIVGGVGALVGEFMKLIQTNVKRQLACSTVAQMGFMILQCGLGFFTAAITHLILHGFFKAYLFLSAGSESGQVVPAKESSNNLKLRQIPALIVSGILGGAIFSLLTGKGTELNSGLILTLVVVLTVIQLTRNMLYRSRISISARIWLLPVLVIPLISMYALVFNGITHFMSGMPWVNLPAELSYWHVLLSVMFLFVYFTMQLNWHMKSPRLYVAMLNWSQPHPKTVSSN